jgi:hypothetical protein
VSGEGQAPVPTGRAVGPTGPTSPADRAVALRLARLHLRLGSLGLARAELEACAGSGELDEAALLDLAEVRWRTGDLPGAGEAAAAAIAPGDASGLALVIAAEAAAAAARPAEARRLAGQALEKTKLPLDRIFAGMPQSSIWPHDAAGLAVPAVPDTLAAETPSAAPASAASGPVAEDRGAPLPAGGGRQASRIDVPSALREASDDLDAGRVERASTRLALVLRLAPQAADRVFDLVAAQGSAALALVRGDALRLLGRDGDASRAYTEAASALDRGSDDGSGAAKRPSRRIAATLRPFAADRRPPGTDQPS